MNLALSVGPVTASFGMHEVSQCTLARLTPPRSHAELRDACACFKDLLSDEAVMLRSTC